MFQECIERSASFLSKVVEQGLTEALPVVSAALQDQLLASVSTVCFALVGSAATKSMPSNGLRVCIEYGVFSPLLLDLCSSVVLWY